MKTVGVKRAIDSLMALGTDLLGQGPICRYESTFAGIEMIYLEWRVMDQESRIRKLVNGGCDNAMMTIDHIELFDGRQVEDYIDMEMQSLYFQEKTIRQQYAGVYGLDPADCDYARIMKLNDFELFLEYTTLTTMLAPGSKMAKNLSAFPKIEMDLDFVTHRICQRNQIKTLPPSRKHRLEVDANEFYKWIDFYGRGVNQYDNRTLATLMSAYTNGDDVSEYAPKGDWREG